MDGREIASDAGQPYNARTLPRALDFDGELSLITSRLHRMRKQLEEDGEVDKLNDLGERLDNMRWCIVVSEMRARTNAHKKGDDAKADS